MGSSLLGQTVRYEHNLQRTFLITRAGGLSLLGRVRASARKHLRVPTTRRRIVTGCLDLVGLRHARLDRVVFRDHRMSECDFYGASLKDVLFERCELREAIVSATTFERVELRGCDLTVLRGAEALRGARMPLNDALANAVLFASVLGIEIVD